MIIESSAGGIVYRMLNKAIEILLGQHSGHHGWVFPKGTIGDNVEDERKEAREYSENVNDKSGGVA